MNIFIFSMFSLAFNDRLFPKYSIPMMHLWFSLTREICFIFQKAKFMLPSLQVQSIYSLLLQFPLFLWILFISLPLFYSSSLTWILSHLSSTHFYSSLKTCHSLLSSDLSLTAKKNNYVLLLFLCVSLPIDWRLVLSF